MDVFDLKKAAMIFYDTVFCGGVGCHCKKIYIFEKKVELLTDEVVKMILDTFA